MPLLKFILTIVLGILLTSFTLIDCVLLLFLPQSELKRHFIQVSLRTLVHSKEIILLKSFFGPLIQSNLIFVVVFVAFNLFSLSLDFILDPRLVLLHCTARCVEFMLEFLLGK